MLGRGYQKDGDLRSDRVHAEVIRKMETCGQIACAVGRLPIRFTVGTGGTIRMRAQATRSVFCRAESASVADSAEWVLAQRRGEPLEKDTSARERQSALRFFNSSEEQA